MISFRYHIVSIVSVFLALAVGIALGGGPLKGEVDDTLVDQARKDADRAQTRVERIQARSQRYTDAAADCRARALGEAPPAPADPKADLKLGKML